MPMVEIYGLNYDFIQQNGHFMMMNGTDEKVIKTDDLARIQVNMLKANAIKGLLPVEIEEIDYQVKFYYEITGRKILAHRLREEKLTMKQLYQILNQIVAVLESSEEYMLSQTNFILHQDFIFMEDDFKSIDLIYLPLKAIEQKPNLKDELRELLFSLVGHVEELTGNSVQQLTQYFQSPSFNLKELTGILKKLHTNIPNQQITSRDSIQRPAEAEASEPVLEQQSDLEQIQENQQKTTATAPKPKPATQMQQKPSALQKKADQKQAKSEDQTEAKKPSLVMIACFAFLAIAIIWKLYDVIMTNSMFYISISLSLIVIAVAVYFGFIYDGKRATENNETNDHHLIKDSKKSIFNKNKKNEVDEEVLMTMNNVQDDRPLNQAVQASEPVDSATYFQELGNQTTLLTQPNATVLLDENPQESYDVAYLNVNRKGQTEKITITQSPFIIGRNAAAVDYMEDSVGISRTHIEIIENESDYFVKDLGSKNGTKQNDEPLVAYKSYQLRDGDSLMIGKVEYIFQKG